MKLTVVTAKQSTSVNLNGLSNRFQMNIKDLSGKPKISFIEIFYENLEKQFS